MTALLQEWVADVGARAGLTAANTRLSSGSVGVAESRLELEVTFASLAEWEQFLAGIPAKEHRAWSQRVQGMIVGGSPRWELFRAVPAFPAGQEPVGAAPAVPVARPAPAPAPAPTVPVAGAPADTAASWAADFLQASGIGASTAGAVYDTQGVATGSGSGASSGSRGSAEGSASGGGSGLSIIDNQEAAEVVLDWKGEPLKINPGDKLPFKFL